VRYGGLPLSPPACIIGGGETTVTVKGRGLGGRNQELALAAAIEIEDERAMAIVSCGTDGSDGPTNAAGAIAAGDSVARARALGLEPKIFLRNNDSAAFFTALGDAIITGPTRTNVMDLFLLIVT
jgi:glycerate 2-kinase